MIWPNEKGNEILRQTRCGTLHWRLTRERMANAQDFGASASEAIESPRDVLEKLSRQISVMWFDKDAKSSWKWKSYFGWPSARCTRRQVFFSRSDFGIRRHHYGCCSEGRNCTLAVALSIISFSTLSICSGQISLLYVRTASLFTIPSFNL